jgi:tripartite-type tricarboxylate transporter receptor subunit TctC
MKNDLTFIRQFARAFACCAIALAPLAAEAQTYPVKAVRIVVGGTGGGSDTTARMIALVLAGPLGQQVLVDNRPSGIIPGDIVSKAAPDGYTLLVTGSSLWVSPLLQSVPFDPVRDFAPITLAAVSPSVLTVHPSLPVKSVKDLIALARARPGELNYGTSGQGSAPHLSAELFKSMAKVDIVRVNYRGAGAALNDLLAGEVQMTFGTTSSVVPHIKSRRLRALAVSSAKPSALLPDLPTLAQSGLPGYESISPAALFAPANTPRPIIDRVNKEVVQGLRRADAKEKLFNVGLEIVGSSPDELSARVKSDIVKWGNVIRDAGIKAQ